MNQSDPKPSSSSPPAEVAERNSLPELLPASTRRPPWGFLSNHSHILVCLYSDPDMRLSEISARVGLTLRIVQRIVRELADEGVITIEKNGRRNRYSINLDYPFRHDLEKHCNIGQLLRLVSGERV